MITWKIDWLECKPEVDDRTNVVITAGWRCNGVDGNATSSVFGTVTMGPLSQQFTAYDSLTESQVLGWCWARGVDKTATEAAVQKLLDQQITPPTIKPALPWA